MSKLSPSLLAKARRIDAAPILGMIAGNRTTPAMNSARFVTLEQLERLVLAWREGDADQVEAIADELRAVAFGLKGRADEDVDHEGNYEPAGAFTATSTSST